jgi:hypothetical protein
MLQTRNNNRQMVVASNRQIISKKKKNKLFSFNPNQLVYDFGEGIVNGLSNQAVRAVNGIVSAFRSKGATKQEIKQMVAPLAQSLTYTSRRPQFNRAEGGLSIEHIENIGVTANGHTSYVIDTTSFGWLTGIANQFEEYQIQLWFAWNPVCSATNSGQVLLAFDYDPVDTADGRYIDAADYFNTADHCVSAIWAPAAIAPKRSVWLKTGNQGDTRLTSPGILHISTTDLTLGYLTVKYQVSLRKPQPSNVSSSYGFYGSYTTATGIFDNVGSTIGNSALVLSQTASLLTIRATPGYKVVVWSSDATAATVTPTILGSGAALIGTRTGSGIAFAARIPPNVVCSVAATVTAPGGATSYKLQIYQEVYNPLYF